MCCSIQPHRYIDTSSHENILKHHKTMLCMLMYVCFLRFLFVSTEDELYYSVDCMYPTKELDNPYLGKTGRIAS